MICSAVPPEATETISYRIPTFRYKEGCWRSLRFLNYCSLFPMSLALMEEFKNEFRNFHTSKGTIHFPMDRPLPAALDRVPLSSRFVIRFQVAGRNLQALGGSLPREGCSARLAAVLSERRPSGVDGSAGRKLERLPAGVSLSVRLCAS